MKKNRIKIKNSSNDHNLKKIFKNINLFNLETKEWNSKII